MVLSKRSLIHSNSFHPKIKSYLKLPWNQFFSDDLTIILFRVFVTKRFFFSGLSGLSDQHCIPVAEKSVLFLYGRFVGIQHIISG